MLSHPSLVRCNSPSFLWVGVVRLCFFCFSFFLEFLLFVCFLFSCIVFLGGGGGGGSDVELDAHLCRYTSLGAPNWGGRTPGSQTPGVPAALRLNVQMDGGRKRLQNCSKLPSSPPSCQPCTAATVRTCLCGNCGTFTVARQRVAA